jgi:hypothetical protein
MHTIRFLVTGAVVPAPVGLEVDLFPLCNLSIYPTTGCAQTGMGTTVLQKTPTADGNVDRHHSGSGSVYPN